MTTSPFAQTPPPPYYAVIFSSQRTAGDAGYGAMAERMVALAAQQPGFLGAESTRGTDGFGITAWKGHAEHLAAQELGISRWYEHYELRIAKVERAYGKTGDPTS